MRDSFVRKKVLSLFFALYIGFLMLCQNAVTVCAQEVYVNLDNGYKVLIEDEAQCLTDLEREDLAEQMKEITAYGNAAFVTILYNEYSSTESCIKAYYEDCFGHDSGTVFMIDMSYRNIWIYSNGEIYDTITDSYADTITDNVYTYASDGDYYQCSSEAFREILILLQGQKIAQPMKYVSNILLAVVLALLINYFIVKVFSSGGKPSEKKLLDSIAIQFQFRNPKTQFINKTKTYSPVSSDSSGGSSGGGRGSRSSGGGGGHSF